MVFYKTQALSDTSQQVFRHAEQFSKGEALSLLDDMALTDTMKLIFNVSKIYPELAETFSPSIPYIADMISRTEISSKPLNGLVSFMINSLTVLDVEHSDATTLFPESDPNCRVDRFIDILDQAVSDYDAEDLETKVIPLLQVLIILYEMAPESARKHMQSLLLPEDNDHQLPIGQSNTLSSRLLRMSTSPIMNLKTATSELLFVLSEKNAQILTQNIGYGYAAGFLAFRGMAVSETAAGTNGLFDPEINPVTGQRFSAEGQDTSPPMTREEKEREAERLFVLFERWAHHSTTWGLIA